MPSDEIGEIKRTVEAHEKRISDLETLIKEKPASARKELSIKEFILQKKATRDLDKTMAVGYYLEHNRNISPFNIKDLEQLFGEAKEPLPKNINDAVNKNIEKGFIMESKEKKDKKKTWALTATGERYVENGFKEEK